MLGYRGSSKPIQGGIVYGRYIPLREILTPEESARRHKAEIAGKRYAKVSIKHPDCRVRCKKGQIIDEKVDKNGIKKVCVRIEKKNWCSEKGNMTWVVASEKDMSDEWVEEHMISNVWEYDKDGNEIDINKRSIVSNGWKSEILEK